MSCLSDCVSTWDTAAADQLARTAEILRHLGVVDLLERQVSTVWRRNVSTFDPQLGDTNLSLALTSTENLRELLVREGAGADSPWPKRGVAITSVDNALRLEVAGLRLGQMKAPPSRSAEPHWHGPAFRWVQGSDIRAQMAERNSRAYRPLVSEQLGRQLALDVGEGAGGSPNGLCDVLLVWTGDVDTATTGGWLGFPCLGELSWYALTSLWSHQPSAMLDGEQGAAQATANFDDRPVPSPTVTLRPAVSDPRRGQE